MNKKGFIAEALVDFYSYIAFVLIIIIFFLLFSMQKCEGPVEQKIESAFEGNEAETVLLNYLRTPLPNDVDDLTKRKGYGDRAKPFLSEHPELYTNKTYAEFLAILESSVEKNIFFQIVIFLFLYQIKSSLTPIL